jgi:hypothetical protein
LRLGYRVLSEIDEDLLNMQTIITTHSPHPVCPLRCVELTFDCHSQIILLADHLDRVNIQQLYSQRYSFYKGEVGSYSPMERSIKLDPPS